MTDTRIQSDPKPRGPFATWLSMLWAEKLAFFAALFLLVALLCAILGPWLMGDLAAKQNLRGRNAPPFDLARGWLMILGADALGRPLLPRIVVAAQNTLMVAGAAVLCSAVVGCGLGLVAGYSRKRAAQWIMRLGDVIMSFPSLLLAVIVLYMLEPSVANIVLVLAITRIPVYLRTTRAEVLEVRERMFVQAARVMGASDRGPDGGAGPRIPDHGLVAVLLAGSGDHRDHLVAEPFVELDAHRAGSRATLAAGNEGTQE